MKTKNIFKALALAMLMPATMLTTACSSDDSIINDEPTATKGFELPVTVNVTRQGDATTRTTYTDNGNGTGTLGFSTGDKLLVNGMDNGLKQFAGILTWQSGGTFSGTITTQNTSYTGTADDLFKNAMFISAYLLPAGYDSKGFIKVSGSGYQMGISYDWTKAFALTKAEAVEQLSRENAGSYSTGFALAPLGFILNFTITGLTPSTEVAVAFTNGTITTSGNVTTDGSGNATFAISTNSANIGTCTLTVGGNNIALPSTSLAKGKIYNITRAVTPPTLAQTMNTADMTVKVKYNYNNEENYCLFSSNGDGTYTFQSGYGYAGGDDCAKDLVVEGGKLVFKQNFYETIDDNWSNFGFSVTFDTSKNTYSNWVGPMVQYFNPSFISVEVNSVPIALTQIITVADLVKEDDQSWSVIIANNPGKIQADGDYVVRISDNAKLQYNPAGNIWQDVRPDDKYQSMFTYKFEGD